MVPLQSKNSRCLCGSGKKYKRCCQSIHNLEIPPLAERQRFNNLFQESMRSSEKWDDAVKEFGEEKVNEVFKKIRMQSYLIDSNCDYCN